MDYATNFAIVEDGVVTNIIWGMIYNTNQEFPNAVQIDNLGVTIGDTYSNGRFYRNGEIVLTVEEIISNLKDRIKDLEGV